MWKAPKSKINVMELVIETGQADVRFVCMPAFLATQATPDRQSSGRDYILQDSGCLHGDKVICLQSVSSAMSMKPGGSPGTTPRDVDTAFSTLSVSFGSPVPPVSSFVESPLFNSPGELSEAFQAPVQMS